MLVLQTLPTIVPCDSLPRSHTPGIQPPAQLRFSSSENASLFGSEKCRSWNMSTEKSRTCFQNGARILENCNTGCRRRKTARCTGSGKYAAGTRCDGKGNIAARQSLTKTPDVRGTMTRTQAQIWSTTTPNGTAREAIRTCRPTIALSSYRPATIYRCSFSGKSYLLTACPLQKSAGHNYR